MASSSCLNTGFLISRQNKLVLLEGSFLPHSFIKVQNTPGFYGKLRITGKYPRPMLPRTQGILIQPAPYRAVTNGCNNSRLANMPTQIRSAPSRNRHMMCCRQFTGKSLNLHDQFWGEKPEDVPVEVVPQDLRDVL